MDITQRASEIKKLMNNALQDLTKLEISAFQHPDQQWKEPFYRLLENECSKKNPSQQCADTWNKIKNGMESYSTKDMDATIICWLHEKKNKATQHLLRTNDQITNRIRDLKNDKNTFFSHDSSNEESFEYYSRMVGVLHDLNHLVETVQKNASLFSAVSGAHANYVQKYRQNIVQMNMLLFSDFKDTVREDIVIEQFLDELNATKDPGMKNHLFNEKYFSCWLASGDNHLSMKIAKAAYKAGVMQAAVMLADCYSGKYDSMPRDYRKAAYYYGEIIDSNNPLGTKERLLFASLMINGLAEEGSAGKEKGERILQSIRKEGHKIKRVKKDGFLFYELKD